MRKFYTGIDIGSFQVKVIVAGAAENAELPMQVLGTGAAPARGIRQGYIIDKQEAVRSIREAVTRAAAVAKVNIKSARVAVGGIGLEEVRSTGDVTLTTSGGTVTDKDIDRALRESEKRTSGKLTNRVVLHRIPLEYRVDGERVFGKPHGLLGTKLAVDALLITTISQHHDDIVEAVEAAGVEVEDVMASPLAASLVSLAKPQKMAGVCLANIGADTLSLMVFDNDVPVSLKMFPVGAGDVTNAIALAFQISLPEAESLKRGGVTGSDIPDKKIQTIIAAKLKDMFTLVNNHLKSIGRARLLPAGVVLTGGGSGLSGAVETAKTILKLPAQVGVIGFLPRSTGIDPSWSVAYGLCRWAYAEDAGFKGSTLVEAFSNAWDSMKQSIRALLP